MAQVGTDRVIELQFSDGQYRLFFEFYAGGNIILTDRALSVISLLRLVNEEREKLRVGLTYPLDDRQNYNGIPPLTIERVRSGLQEAVSNGGDSGTFPQGKISRRKPREALRKTLAAFLNEYPPVLLDHALQVVEFDVRVTVEQILQDSLLLDKLMMALSKAQNVVDHILDDAVCKGIIIASSKKRSPHEDQTSHNENVPMQEHLLYEDFQAFRPQQFGHGPETTILEFDGFNLTVDEFFSSIEAQKLETKLTAKEENAKTKLETARLDHQNRLGGLQQVQELHVRRAQAIETNLHKVKEAISAVNGLLASGMDWVDVSRLIEMEQGRHNMVAELIKLPLKLFENTITLLLNEATRDDEEDYDGDETGSDVSAGSTDENSISAESAKNAHAVEKRLPVDVDLALSPWANARQHYDQKKDAAVKEQKTLRSSQRALKSTERKINTDLQKGLRQEKELMRPLRRAFWFEKFAYFISSEGYLVIGGKDLQQTEILYKKHLKKGDIYVHADLQGAIPVIVRNKPGMADSPIPPSTLSQAGTLTIATSSAWDSKAVMSAWWVHAEQVSKIAPSGEYLTPGCFNIQDQKCFLPPTQLLLGFGVMFQISEASKARHLRHRVRDENSLVPGSTSEGANEETAPQTSSVFDAAQSDEGSNDARSEDGNVWHDEAMDGNDGTACDHREHDGSSEDCGENPLQPTPNSRFARRTSTDTSAIPQACSNAIHMKHVHDTDSVRTEDEVKPKESSEPTSEDENLTSFQQGDTSVMIGGKATARSPKAIQQPGDGSKPLPLPSVTSLGNNVHPLLVRGKHGKRNKFKIKYAEQDDDERDLALRLLGSTAAKQRASEEAAVKAAKEQELTAQKERRRRQHAEATAKGKAAEEIRRLQYEGPDTLDNDEEDMVDLETFVGAPLPGDDILQYLVVCAPWSALGCRCRWSVKLQPGSTKKGKAVREILGKWNGMILDREKKNRSSCGEGNEASFEEDNLKKKEGEMIRSIREPEVIGLVPVSKVRIAMGASEAGSKGRAGAGKSKRGGRGSQKQR